jgi:hypothetical protein
MKLASRFLSLIMILTVLIAGSQAQATAPLCPLLGSKTPKQLFRALGAQGAYGPGGWVESTPQDFSATLERAGERGRLVALLVRNSKNKDGYDLVYGYTYDLTIKSGRPQRVSDLPRNHPALRNGRIFGPNSYFVPRQRTLTLSKVAPLYMELSSSEYPQWVPNGFPKNAAKQTFKVDLDNIEGIRYFVQ